MRIRNLCGSDETIYTYNTQSRLSQLLMKTTNGVVTKYVYGLGLIGEEKQGCYKTYHFDYRGSTVAITNESGTVTDTFKYDTYGKLISRTGSNFVIFGYNGRDGVVTDRNGLIYMRARYYSPELKRFVNADIIKGEITNAITLNRYAYANGNPVSNVDPFGLAAEERGKETTSASYWDLFKNSDGSYSLYDNTRFDSDRLFREQILSIMLDKWSFDLVNGELTLGELSLTVMTGGWEFEHLDLSLLDFGKAKLAAGYKDGELDITAMASIWAPYVTFELFGVEITASFHAGSIGGGLNIGKGKFIVGATYGLGGSLSFEW